MSSAILVIACVNSIVVYSARGARSFEDDSAVESDHRDLINQSVSDGFECPEECQECCSADWAKTFLGNFGTSEKHFKCILRGQDAPANRACSEPKAREVSWTQFEVECAYTEKEEEAKVWKGLVDKCSQATRCCCDEGGDWTEQICLGMENGDEVETTQTSSPSRKSMETYKRLAQTFENREGPCINPSYQAVEYQKNHKLKATTEGCCLQTAEKSKREEYGCRQHCTGSMTQRRCQRKCNHRTVKWTACTSFEMLYHCTSDAGLTQNGQLYKRIPKDGICFGDSSTPERLAHTYGLKVEDSLANLKLNSEQECPEGFSWQVAQSTCKCPTYCGKSLATRM